MDTKTKGIVATVAAVVLCGCPGLLMCCIGAMSALVSRMPGADIDVMGNSDPASAMIMGLVLICLSFIFILIPIAVGFFMFRKKPKAATEILNNETLPPTS